jgi:hypothetical protein
MHGWKRMGQVLEGAANMLLNTTHRALKEPHSLAEGSESPVTQPEAEIRLHEAPAPCLEETTRMQHKLHRGQRRFCAATKRELFSHLMPTAQPRTWLPATAGMRMQSGLSACP